MQCVSIDNIRLSAARCAAISSAACRRASEPPLPASNRARRDISDPQIIELVLEDRTRTGKDLRYVIGTAKDHRRLTSHEVIDYVGGRAITVVNICRHQPSFLQPQQEGQARDRSRIVHQNSVVLAEHATTKSIEKRQYIVA